MEKLTIALRPLGLTLFHYSDDKVAVVKPGIANSLLWFNPKLRGAAYDGSVSVKAFNAVLFTATQIREALRLVDLYMLGEESE